MYKKIFSAILFGVITIASTSTFVSCKDYDDDINNLQAQIDDLVKNKVATINTTLTTLRTDLTTLQNTKADKTDLDKKADKTELEAAVALLEKAIADLEDTHKKDVASLTAKDAELDAAIVKVNQQISDILKLLSDQDGNIQQVGKDLKALNDKLSKFESEFGTLSDAFRGLSQKVTNLESALAAQEAKLKALADAVADGNATTDPDLQNKIDAAGNKIKELDAKIDALKTELTKKLNDEIKAVNDKIDGVNGDLQALKQAHTDFATQTTNELNTLKTNINNVREQAEATATALGTLDVMFNILVSDLRSLVYMPKLYVDGIETIEYPYLRYALLHKTDNRAMTRYENDLSAARAPQNLGGEIYDLIDKTANDSVSYGPAWPLQYHMNPGNAQVEFSDVQGYYAYNAEVLTRAFFDTKANNASAWGMVAADRWDNWYDENDVFFSTTKGILNIGLKLGDKVANVDDPANRYFPSDLTEDANDANAPESVKNIVLALQVKSSAVNKTDTTITSDYAQLLPEKVKIEGLIWYKGKTPTYWDNDNDRIKDFWENKKGYGPAKNLAWGAVPAAPTYQHNPAGWDYGYRKGTQGAQMGRDTLCPVTHEWIHVWETPEDALRHPADIELYINKPVSLVEHLGVHWYFEQNAPLTQNVVDNKPMKTWYYNDKMLQRYGFVWVFDTLDYFVDSNQTHDSRYITVNDHKTGLIEAQNVKESGATYEDETHTAVGREPLVRVRLYHFSNIKDMNTWKNIESVGVKKFNDDNINSATSSKYAPVLDGYIRVHITRPELLEIDKYPTWNVTFDLCNDATAGPTTWAQFSKWVLTDALDNMEKEQFDAAYNVEQEGAVDDVNKRMELVQYVKPRTTASEDKYYTYKKLTDAPATWAPNKNNKDEYKIGKIWTRYDEVGTTNHTYYWQITAKEMESLTHHATGDNGENGVTITRYIHYTGHFYSSTDPNNAAAKYDDIFIKLSMKITRKDVPVSETKTKDENYWYDWDGSWNKCNHTDANTYRAIAENALSPVDLGSTVPWTNQILRTWDTNKVSVSNSTASKFYFAPIEYKIQAQDGTWYIVTPKRGKDDAIFDKFICKYITGNTHGYIYAKKRSNLSSASGIEEVPEVFNGDLVKNNEILNKCAIKYAPEAAEIGAGFTASEYPTLDGVFSNDTLFAVKEAEYATAREYEPIAIFTNTATGTGGGQLTLLHEYVENQWIAQQDHGGATGKDYQPSGAKWNDADPANKENAYTEACLNAVGYILSEIERDATTGLMTGKFVNKGNPLNNQLRAYVGVIATNNCNVANQMKDYKIDNFAVFQMTWERPINMLQEADFMVDAINNGDYIYMVDILRLFDWRGASNKGTGASLETGYMWGDKGIPSYWTVQDWRPNQWLWAYYNVKAINVDLATNHVYTNLSQANANTFVTMNTVSGMVELTGKSGKTLNTWLGDGTDFDITPFNSHDQNDAIIDYMGLERPRQEGYDAVKGKFGYIYYENNGQNVNDFDVLVPVTVVYDWGEIKAGWKYNSADPKASYVKIHIHYTRGN